MNIDKKILEKYKNYLIARKLSLNYYNIMRIFFAFLEKEKTEYKNITQETITVFFNAHPEYSKSSLTQYIKAGRHLDICFLEISKEQSQWYKINYFKGHKNTPKFLTLEELKEIIKNFCIYENRLMFPSKVKAFLTFIYMTGLRKGEILNLKRTDINLKTSPCEIRLIGKGDKERFVYFSEKYSPGLKQMLIDYFASETEKENAFNVNLDGLNYFFKKMNKYLKERKINCHLFRHSFSKYLFDKGAPLSYIQSLLGHSNITTTMIYLNPTSEQIKKWMEK